MTSTRIIYKDALYHVYNRGNSKRDIFIDSDDYSIFLKICSNTFKKLPFYILTFCLMPNHYHLLIQTPEANLPDVMRLINQKYAIYFNQKYNNVGYVFQGRYKAKIVENFDYLNQLVAYIHLNPLKAGLVKEISNWDWSSYPVICKQCIKPNFFNSKRLEKLFGIENIVNEIDRANEYYNRYSNEQLFASLGTDLISKIEVLKRSKNKTPLELSEELVESCLSEKLTSTKKISQLTGLSESYIRRIKRNNAFSPGP